MISIKKIINELLYVHIFSNLSEMNQFLKRYNVLKPTEEEMNYQNIPIFIKVIESIIIDLPKQKALGLDGFTGEFY